MRVVFFLAWLRKQFSFWYLLVHQWVRKAEHNNCNQTKTSLQPKKKDSKEWKKGIHTLKFIFSHRIKSAQKNLHIFFCYWNFLWIHNVDAFHRPHHCLIQCGCQRWKKLVKKRNRSRQWQNGKDMRLNGILFEINWTAIFVKRQEKSHFEIMWKIIIIKIRMSLFVHLCRKFDQSQLHFYSDALK